MERHQKNLPSRTVTIWHNGIPYHGSYTVYDQRLTVRLGMATISEKLPHSAESPLAFAAQLLIKLVSVQKQDS